MLQETGRGEVVVDLEQGERQVRVAVSPGRYVVRQRLGTSTSAHEVEVLSGQSVAIDETQLTLAGAEGLSRKEPTRILTTMTTLPAHAVELQQAIGIQHGEPSGIQIGGAGLTDAGNIAWGITDRLQLSKLQLFYRFGEAAGREWQPFAGCRFSEALTPGVRPA